MMTANLWSERSTCKRMKVGVVITNLEMTNIVSIGYNGGAKGDTNNSCTGETGNCTCLHSEINALIKPRSLDGKIMFITHLPCLMCSKAITNAGIQKIYYRNDYRDRSGLKLLQKLKIKTVRI